MRRTKIVATLGPASRAPGVVRALLEAGADVVRLNSAHGSPEAHRQAARTARARADELGRPVGVLMDLPGPKMRTGPVVGDEVELVPGQRFTLAGAPVDGDEHGVTTTVAGLAGMVHPGDEVFLADGQIVLSVEAVDGDDVRTEVVRGGALRSRKGLSLPRSEHLLDTFTTADEAALALALDLRVDFVGVSFVRVPSDVVRVRSLLPKRRPRPRVVAKIETRVALEHLDGIIEAADAVMVARGDLGIQVDVSMVPLLQKEIIAAGNAAGRPVITATQMLGSMTRSPLPTRAEAADVANAVIDGSDALMLSEETAVGGFPVEAVATMARIARGAESWPRDRHPPSDAAFREDPVSWAVAHAAVEAAEDLGVAAILCPTRSGATARRVAAFRPGVPVAGLSTRPDVLGGLTLTWGCSPSRPGSPRTRSGRPMPRSRPPGAPGS
ncbi:MAG: pyruvate kinase [Acidimicrobiia bacterium]|nr:pyruvate kinase [Acidimicrobiia bacterium]